jgi:hypothetical protein
MEDDFPFLSPFFSNFVVVIAALGKVDAGVSGGNSNCVNDGTIGCDGG